MPIVVRLADCRPQSEDIQSPSGKILLFARLGIRNLLGLSGKKKALMLGTDEDPIAITVTYHITFEDKGKILAITFGTGYLATIKEKFDEYFELFDAIASSIKVVGYEG